MRRLVLKWRETEKLLESVTAKVTNNYDVFKNESKSKTNIQ